jgi:hypothetical protein
VDAEALAAQINTKDPSIKAERRTLDGDTRIVIGDKTAFLAAFPQVEEKIIKSEPQKSKNSTDALARNTRSSGSSPTR